MNVKILFSLSLFALLLISACEDQGDPVTANTPVPVLSLVAPDSGNVSDTITVTGTNFGSSRGTSVVSFGGASATAYISWNDTQIKTIVPSGISSGTLNVSVNVGGKSSNTKSFKSLAAVTLVKFSTDIVPLIAAYNCASCHPNNGGFSVATHATIITRVTVGNGDGSLLVQKLRGTAAGNRMPNGGPIYMTPAEIQKFVDWINQGALNN